MKYLNLTFNIGMIFFIFPTVLFSQTVPSYSSYSANSITLRSDAPSKSALLSNISSNLVGDLSPFIGVAQWQDSNRQIECISMLEFEMKELPNFIKAYPDRVEKAELILYPNPGKEKNNEPITFFVKRIWQPWTDSLTTWADKPFTKSSDKIKVKTDPQRTRALRIDVTKMVINMLKFGNYGFMLAGEDSIRQKNLSGWFASAKHNDRKVRPVLIITYETAFQEGNNKYMTQQNRQSQQHSQQNSTTTQPPNTGGN